MRATLPRTLATLLAAVLLQPLLAGSSSAQIQTATATGQFTVRLTVSKACTVTPPTELNFGTITDFNSTGSNANAFSGIEVDLTVRCTNLTTYTIGLSNGDFTGATMNTRKMQKWLTTGTAHYGGTGDVAGSTDTIAYNLYKNACATSGTAWGSTGTDMLQSLTSTGANQIYKICGKLAPLGAGNLPSAGEYQDKIQVTITY